MFKNLAGLGSLLRHAQQLGGQLKNLSEEMKHRRATGSAGGGMVEVEINGLLEVLRCTIDEKLASQNDRELLEDLVVAAVNQAISKGKQLHAEAMKDLTGGIELPGINEAIARFTGTPNDPFPPAETPDEEDQPREV
jgi:nucleoid-associated protein EbfC